MKHFRLPYVENGIWMERDKSDQAIDMPALHTHACHEIYFLFSGERRFFLDNKIFDVQPGDLVVLPKGSLHRTTAPGSEGFERYVLYFRESDIEEWIRDVGREDFLSFLESGCIQLSEEYADIVRKDLHRIEREQIQKGPLSKVFIKNLLEHILLYAIRYGKIKNQEKEEGADKIQAVAQYISQNYANEISLQEMANMAFMEKTYFSKRFKQLTGFGFKEYLIQTRVQAAKQMLVTTAKPVTEISDACGFSSSNYFGDMFKRLVGVSPARYRKEEK